MLEFLFALAAPLLLQVRGGDQEGAGGGGGWRNGGSEDRSGDTELGF